MTDLADSVQLIVRSLPRAKAAECGEPAATDPTSPRPVNLPDEFWTARPTLALIRQHAHSRARSADAVLGAVLARVSAATDPAYYLPAIVGARGSLNLFVALIGPTGSGKTSSVATGSELVPVSGEQRIDGLQLGSGEGLVEAFLDNVSELGDDGKTVTVKRQTKRCAFAYLDEGSALADLGDRKGSTLLPTLRTAWIGGALGQANATAERKRHLPAHAYRFALVVGFQTEAALPLLAAAAAGTPQRFVWLSAVDPSIPDGDDLPDPPGPLGWHPFEMPGLNGITVDRAIGFPAEVTAEVRRADVDANRGDTVVATLDAHRNLARMKVAATLALLEQRTETDVDDWHLAGMVIDVSRATQELVGAEARRFAIEKERAAIAREVRRHEAVDQSAGDVSCTRMAKAIARHVHKGECDPCSRACASKAGASRDRQRSTVDEAVALAAERGWLVVDGKTYRPGEARPL